MSVSVSVTTLSPNDAAISSSVLCRVCVISAKANRKGDQLAHLRKVEVRDYQEEKSARDKDVVVILSDIGEGTWTSFCDAHIDLRSI